MEFIIGKGVNWRNKQFQGKRFSTNNDKLIYTIHIWYIHHTVDRFNDFRDTI